MPRRALGDRQAERLTRPQHRRADQRAADAAGGVITPAARAVTPSVTCFGGKVTAGPKIAAMLPPHEHYVEPFAGSRAVLLTKRPGRTGTVNDLAPSFTTFSPAQGAQSHQTKPYRVSQVAAMLGVLGTGTLAKAGAAPTGPARARAPSVSRSASATSTGGAFRRRLPLPLPGDIA
jgi:hypothetical protein